MVWSDLPCVVLLGVGAECVFWSDLPGVWSGLAGVVALPGVGAACVVWSDLLGVVALPGVGAGICDAGGRYT